MDEPTDYGHEQGFRQGWAEWGTGPCPAEMARALDPYARGYMAGRAAHGRGEPNPELAVVRLATTLGRFAIDGAHEGATTVRLVELPDGTVIDGPSTRIPTESVAAWMRDLRHTLDGHQPTSGDPVIDAAIRGEGQFIARGNDGLVFHVGAHVVKVSSVVPFQPWNGGRTLVGAHEHGRREYEAHAALAGISIVARVTGLSHEGRWWTVKPFLAAVGTLTGAELAGIRADLVRIHERGWCVRDRLQFMRDRASRPVLIDLGSAEPNVTDHAREGDEEELGMLYRDHGAELMPSGAKLERREAFERVTVDRLVRRGEMDRARVVAVRWRKLAMVRAGEILGDGVADDDRWDVYARWLDGMAEVERALKGAVGTETAQVSL